VRITQDEFNNWWGSPVGMEFQKMLAEDLQKLGHGNMAHSFARDQVGNAIEVGRYMRTLEIMKLTYELLVGG
jgi:hypothetical protein